MDLLTTTALQAERHEEQYKTLRAMLKLLNQLSNLDNAADGHVSQVVVTGMDLLIPLITTEHLKFPKLRRAFFVLLAHIFEVYSGQVAALPRASFISLHSALCFGMGVREDAEAEAAVFEAAAALTKHHLLAVRAGAQGLGPNNAPDAEGKTPLSGLLQALLQRVLIDDSTVEAIDYAAEAALPLILSEQQFFQSIAGALGLVTVMSVFSQLAGVAGMCSNLDRPSRRKFQTAFRQFVVDIRAALFRR